MKSLSKKSKIVLSAAVAAPTTARVARRRAGVLGLADPVVVPPSALARIPAGLTPDGLLTRSVRARDLDVEIPFPEVITDAGNLDQVALMWDGAEVGARLVIDDPSKMNVPIPTVLPAALRTEGRHVMHYEVWGGFTGLPIGTGASRPIVVDLTVPGGTLLGRIEFDREIEENGLTSAQLTAMGDVLVGRAPTYEGMAEGDWLIGRVNGVAELSSSGEVPVGGVGQDVEVRFTREQLEKGGDGRAEFAYFVADRANNISIESALTYIQLLLSGAIDDLAPPIVPLYDDDLLITDADGHGPVTVAIPGHIGILENDTIEVQWGAELLSRVPVLAGDVGRDPLLEVPVPYAKLWAEWLRLGGSGSLPLDVTYRAFRGTMLLGEATAPTTVVVNLDVPGGEDPDPEDPVHGLLAPPLVTSSGGTQNRIPPEDSQDEATASIPFFNLATPPVGVFKENDEIVVTWNTTALTMHRVTLTEFNDQLPIPIPVPAAVVSASRGTLPVSYTVTRRIDPTHANVALSPTQPVEVESLGDQPGGGNPLPLSEFTERNGNNAIGYADALDGTPLEIPFYLNKAIGNVIAVGMEIYVGARGQHGRLEDVLYFDTHRVDANDDLNGPYTFTVDANTLLKLNSEQLPVEQRGVGQGRAVYAVSTTEGSTPVTSGETRVILDMRPPNP